MNSFLLVFISFFTSMTDNFNMESYAIEENINFTLVNRSTEDISLKFPGNPATIISAKSQSKVNLNKGAKIYFLVKKKKYLLMSVKAEDKGKSIIVDELIRKRKESLGLK